MTPLTVKIHNCQTNEITERDMTAEELAQVEKDKALDAARSVMLKAAATAKADLLKRLGLTEDEARLLLS
jgi:hypothetical protein